MQQQKEGLKASWGARKYSLWGREMQSEETERKASRSSHTAVVSAAMRLLLGLREGQLELSMQCMPRPAKRKANADAEERGG